MTLLSFPIAAWLAAQSPSHARPVQPPPHPPMVLDNSTVEALRRSLQLAHDRPGGDACIEVQSPDHYAGWYCVRFQLLKPRGAEPAK
jgi:hypothetical protein